MGQRLRVGVIGLGRRWPAYRAALLRLAEIFDVRCVCDPVAGRARTQARLLGCAAAGGVVDLVERDDVDAVLFTERAWWGLWPLEQACRVRKPVFCAAPLVADDAHADDLAERIGAADLPVMMAHPLQTAPALGRLHALLEQRLGPARAIRVSLSLPGPRHSRGDLLTAPAVPVLLGMCADLLGGPPASVSAAGDASGSLVSLLLQGQGGGGTQLTVWTGPAVTAGCRLEVAAENGTASAVFPRTARWRDSRGVHAHRLRPVVPQEAVLTHFAEALRSGRQPRPGLAEAHEALTWLHAARRSRDEGRRATVDEVAPAPPPAE
jgi:predicted dehydrogenase